MKQFPGLDNILQLADCAINNIDNKVNEKVVIGDGKSLQFCLEFNIQTFFVDKARIKELKNILAGVHQNDYSREVRIELIGFIEKYHPLSWRPSL